MQAPAAFDASRPSNVSRFSLYVLAAMVLVLALMVWNLRHQRKVQAAALRSALDQRRLSQRAVALLYQALWADNHRTYAARVTTYAVYGNTHIQSVAQLTREPQHLAIRYVSGDRRGLSSGFNQRFSWRQASATSPLRAYAAIRRDATEMGAHRFALMLDNYRADWKGQRTVGGRTADIVEISPFNTADGARGPAKRLWIDTATQLTLRVETYNYQMQPVMSSTLSELDLAPSISASTFPAVPEITEVAKTDPWMAQDMGDDNASVLRLTHLQPPQARELPPGFHFESVGVHRCAEAANAPIAALSRYTDGLNTVTIFALKPAARPQHEHNAAEPEAGVREDGTVETCDFGPGTLVMSQRDGQRLIAVGDLPAQTLYRVLGVKPQAGVPAHAVAAHAVAAHEVAAH